MPTDDRRERLQTAASYAQALHALACEKGCEGEVLKELTQLGSALATSPGLMQFLESPVVTVQQRQQFLDQLADGVSRLVYGVLTVMNRRRRLAVLGELIELYAAQQDRHLGRIPATVTTAEPVDEATMERIRQALRRYLGRDPIIEYRIDPALVGGFVARAGDVLVDASVKTQLTTVRDHLIVRGEDEVQSGRDRVGYQA